MLHDTWKFYEIQIVLCINKSFIEHSHTHSFCIAYSCFHAAIAELSSSCDRNNMAYGTWNIYYMAFYGKISQPLVQISEPNK